jgi:transcriptional regulator with XRE-family HTH domain
MAKRFRNCVGPQVRTLRKKKELTQDQLAARLQLAGLHTFDRVTVAKIECQIRSVYDFELSVLSEVLGVPPDELLPSHRRLKASLDDLMAGGK